LTILGKYFVDICDTNPIGNSIVIDCDTNGIGKRKTPTIAGEGSSQGWNQSLLLKA
jgi:hypothetical protein